MRALNTPTEVDHNAADLQVLDPEQNSTFEDHYINLPFDLSDVIFVCTANTTTSLSAPLLDRMEVSSLKALWLCQQRFTYPDPSSHSIDHSNSLLHGG